MSFCSQGEGGLPNPPVGRPRGVGQTLPGRTPQMQNPLDADPPDADPLDADPSPRCRPFPQMQTLPLDPDPLDADVPDVDPLDADSSPRCRPLPQMQTPPSDADPLGCRPPGCRPPRCRPPDTSTSGRYASYWNAFLFSSSPGVALVGPLCPRLRNHDLQLLTLFYSFPPPNFSIPFFVFPHNYLKLIK